MIQITHNQMIFSWIALIAIGIGQCLPPSSAVFCTDAHGNTKIELGCYRATNGDCIAACSTAGESSRGDFQSKPHPCQDIPLASDALTAFCNTRFGANSALISWHPAVGITPVSVVTSITIHGFNDYCINRPPDIVLQLRTIVILV